MQLGDGARVLWNYGVHYGYQKRKIKTTKSFSGVLPLEKLAYNID